MSSIQRSGACVAAAALAVSLLACGGGNDGPAGVQLPTPGGITGQLICYSAMSPDSSRVIQGTSVIVTFTLADVNLIDRGRFLPVSFEGEGVTIVDPPTLTDGNGVAAVRFVARSNYVGPGSVRLIQPDRQLLCRVDFTIVRATCFLEAKVIDLAGDVVADYDRCSPVARTVERHLAGRVVYRVLRPHVVTGLPEPVPGALVRLTATGFNFQTMVIGPTDVNGEVEAGDTDGDRVVEIFVEPHPTRTGPATLAAEVVNVDVNGDTAPDNLPCSECSITFDVIDPVCDDHLDVVGVVYHDFEGSAFSGPLRPALPDPSQGQVPESADVTFEVVVDGVVQAGVPVVITATGGVVSDGSQSGPSILTTTNGLGRVTVSYTPSVGTTGPQTITASTGGNVTCEQSAVVQVVTCDFLLELDPAVVMPGGETLMTLTLDPDTAVVSTAVGERVSITATRGFFTPPGPLIRNLDGDASVTVLYNASSSPSTVDQVGTVSVSFIDGFPCDTVTKSFTITAPDSP